MPERGYRGRARLRYLREDWRKGSLNLCVFYSFWAGLLLLSTPLYRRANDHSVYAHLPTGTVIVFGAVYVSLSLWSILFPEKAGAIVVSCMVAGLTAYASLHPFVPLGMVFACSLAVAIAMEIRTRLHPGGGR